MTVGRAAADLGETTISPQPTSTSSTTKSHGRRSRKGRFQGKTTGRRALCCTKAWARSRRTRSSSWRKSGGGDRTEKTALDRCSTSWSCMAVYLVSGLSAPRILSSLSQTPITFQKIKVAPIGRETVSVLTAL